MRARHRFSTGSGSVLPAAGRKKQQAGGPAARDPWAKVAALWRADLADDDAWRYGYESDAWGYATLRWLLVDQAEDPGPVPAPALDADLAGAARLRSATGRAADLARRAGPGQARQALVGQLSTDAGGLFDGRRGAPPARELLAAAAEATLLAGCLTYACWPLAALAQAYLIQALALAHACGDRQLGAATLCAMSQQAVFCGHLNEARTLVNAAIEGSRDVAHPVLSVHLRLLTARDHVQRNELISCVRALKAAAVEFDRAGPGHRPRWTRWFTEADPLLFALVLAAAYLAAGLPAAAYDTQLVAQLLAGRVQADR